MTCQTCNRAFCICPEPVTFVTVVIDGPALTVPGGDDAGKIWRAGTSLVLDLLEAHPEARVCVAWEPAGEGPRARALIDPAYKAAREPHPAGYYKSCDEWSDEFLPILGVSQAWADPERWEADDVLATVARTWARPVLVWTADKDMLQLVEDEVHVIRRTNGPAPITPLDILERTGLTAKGWQHYLALAGDKGDGIDGCPGVGDKRAKTILEACPDFFDLLRAGDIAAGLVAVGAHAPKMGTWVKKAFDNRETVLRCYDLVELRTCSLYTVPAERCLESAAAWLRDRDMESLARRVDAIAASE